jgi:hypothetical protein
MGNAVFVYDNFADRAILSGGSYVAGLPRANAQDADIGLVARTTDATSASTRLHVDLGTEQPVGGVVLGPINMTPGSTYRVRSYDQAAMTTLRYDSGIKTIAGAGPIDWTTPTEWTEWENPGFWLGIESLSDLADTALYLVEIVPAAQATLANKRFWKIELFDAGNADGYLEFGRLLVGRAWRPSINYGDGADISVEPLTDVVETLSGRRAHWERGLRRVWRASFDRLPEDEAFAEVLRMQARLRTSRQFFLCPDPEDEDFLQRRSFLATLKAPPPLSQINLFRASTSFDCEEVL